MARKARSKKAKTPSGIPRIIHQVAAAGERSASKGDAESWKRLHPGWDCRFWSEADLDAFIASRFPDLHGMYRAYPHLVQRQDFARYLLLKHFGGVSAHMDARCLTSFDPLAGETRVVLAREPRANLAQAKLRGLDWLVFNGVMASPPGHPLWNQVLENCRLLHPRMNIDVLDTTGPFLLSATVKQWPDQSQISINAPHLFSGADGRRASAPIPRPGDYDHLRLSSFAGEGPRHFFPPGPTIKTQRINALKWAWHVLRHGHGLPLRTLKAGIKMDLLRQTLPQAENPDITILIPLRDAAQYLAQSFQQILNLDYPQRNLRILFGHGDSRDDTGALIEGFIARHGHKFREAASIALTQNAPRLENLPRSMPGFQLQRRSGIARARNELLAHALSRPADWFLWIDADVVHYPPGIIRRLLAAKEKIVMPHCVLVPGGDSFDLNAFLNVYPPDSSELHRYVLGGLFQPPIDHDSRRHLHDLRYLERVPLHGVGGTMLLVDANVHRAGLIFPDRPFQYVIETEAFGFAARALGVTPIGLPQVEIVHANH